ncbi:hypothetical protein [Pontibacter anaerobius]|uniref:Transposase n=1 Tax=Pontibacter anaerobius TaxID=2993940 RepID=A0ABT3RIN4_9BACT|nr:hypothetical protein [Pontibacter anaerobius]MCX2741234.1 hypothetical protein [Pontibacter anaerobius]
MAEPARKVFPKWQLAYYYFRKWHEEDTLKRLNFRLNIQERHGKVASPSLMSVGTQRVKVTRL